jgi:hypothetical protein
MSTWQYMYLNHLVEAAKNKLFYMAQAFQNECINFFSKNQIEINVHLHEGFLLRQIHISCYINKLLNLSLYQWKNLLIEQ